ncbi:MAG TPA: hypothetical protein VE134_04000 [Methanomicrobiales archaeon]|nr:hypothetical protein [Methanomicrobiales archaeon]
MHDTIPYSSGFQLLDFHGESHPEKPGANDTVEDGSPGDRAVERHDSDGEELPA